MPAGTTTWTALTGDGPGSPRRRATRGGGAPEPPDRPRRDPVRRRGAAPPGIPPLRASAARRHGSGRARRSPRRPERLRFGRGEGVQEPVPEGVHGPHRRGGGRQQPVLPVPVSDAV